MCFSLQGFAGQSLYKALISPGSVTWTRLSGAERPETLDDLRLHH